MALPGFSPGTEVGYDPVAIMMCFASSALLSTLTVVALRIIASPVMTATPFFFKRKFTPAFSLRAIFWARLRALPQLKLSFSGAMPSIPKASASCTFLNTLALSIIALVGMQPQLRHIPPICVFSMRAVFMPSCPARMAAT
ncbi:MAG: hypothetical protein BWY65_02308 [Firmicutes bacterium ADurb.Bin373]|nr:MAG: hypothetical protein BWY65_02308 [Firmicutes bacterium ADurb.Bin373]